jgi:hypothetical protein
MSVYAMAKREVDAMDPSHQQPESAAPAAAGDRTVDTAVLAPRAPAPLVAPVPVGNTGIGMALSSIGTYIPTEVMATYATESGSRATTRTPTVSRQPA